MPKRGLGDATVQVLHDHARKRRVPLTEAARAVIATDELKPKPRGALRDLLEAFDRWRKQRESCRIPSWPRSFSTNPATPRCGRRIAPPTPPAGWTTSRSSIRSMEEFENLQGFLEHISLVMDNEKAAEADAVNIMTLHSAKGLEFDTVFLPGWEEGLFPHQRTLDDQGRAGLEEERRLAHVGLTRARKRAKIYFATNRRMHGLWQTNIPSRFLDELPEAHVEVKEAEGGFGGYGGYGASRFDATTSFGSNYTTPGWQRAQAKRDRGGGFSESATSGIRRPTTTSPPSPHPGEDDRAKPDQVRAHGTPAPPAASPSPSKANWWRNPPARSPPSRSATASSTRNSATATSPPSTATS